MHKIKVDVKQSIFPNDMSLSFCLIRYLNAFVLCMENAQSSGLLFCVVVFIAILRCEMYIQHYPNNGVASGPKEFSIGKLGTTHPKYMMFLKIMMSLRDELVRNSHTEAGVTSARIWDILTMKHSNHSGMCSSY